MGQLADWFTDAEDEISCRQVIKRSIQVINIKSEGTPSSLSIRFGVVVVGVVILKAVDDGFDFINFFSGVFLSGIKAAAEVVGHEAKVDVIAGKVALVSDAFGGLLLLLLCWG